MATDLADRTADYAANNLVAAAQADARLQADIKAAIAAGGGASFRSGRVRPLGSNL